MTTPDVPDPSAAGAPPTPVAPRGTFLEVLGAFLRLGLTSFGGPVAHVGYVHREIVERRRWLDDAAYVDLVALCQFLPGPASTQTAISLGTLRAGLPGGLAAWLGFTLPSAVLMILFAMGMDAFGGGDDAAWLHGLKVVAVAVVALAVWAMAKRLCPDRVRGTIAVAAALVCLTWANGLAQLSVIAAGGVAGWLLFRKSPPEAVGAAHAWPVTRRQGAVAAATLVALLVGLPILAHLVTSDVVAIFDRFFRTGSLVFGGGHVVLPLLEADVVPPGWTTHERFLAGYGAAQAVPGPLFSIAAYLGAVITAGPGGWLGGAIALVAIFLPSYLLVVAALPLWGGLRASHACRASIRGANAAVVGLLLAALYSPVWTSAVRSVSDFGLALSAFAALALWKWPPWLVVIVCGVAAEVLGRIAN